MNLCAFCFRPGPDEFCEICSAEFAKLDLPESRRFSPLRMTEYRVLSTLAYRGICRQSIVACKAHGFLRLGAALVRRSLESPCLRDMLSRSTVIMPAPSSLWSRMRGSLDLASILAEELARAAALPLVPPPRALSFRWQKQALKGLSQRRGVFRSHQKLYDASYFEPHMPTPLRGARMKVLVVDDVITSGSTLRGLAACFEEVDFEFYTLASAYRPGKDHA